MVKAETKKKRLVLLDAHAIIHRAYHALPEFTSSKGELTGALYGLSAMLIRIINDLKPDYILAAYDLPGKTFRHEAFEGYKAQRPKADPGLISQINRSRDIFKSFAIPIYEYPGFEADDVLGTAVEKFKKEKDLEIIIASGDMDTLQLVEGKKIQVYTLKKGITDTVLYDEKAVLERFGFSPEHLPDYKGLRGDPSDNIPGIRGIGEKTATILIKKFGSLESLYEALKKGRKIFTEIGLTERIINLLVLNKEEALFSKILGEIRRDVPIDFELPSKKWKETVDLKEIEKLFRELDFRNLIDRAAKIFGLPSGQAGTETKELVPESPTESLPPEDEVKKICLALWLLNSEISNASVNEILEYAGENTFTKAREKILKELKEKKLDQVYETIELPLIPIIKKAEMRGILLDVVYLKKIAKIWREKLAGIETEIYKLCGLSFNLNSPKQLSEVLFQKLLLSPKGLKKTAGGALSTRESELQKLLGLHPAIEKILSYRELQKVLSTYVEPLPELVDKNNRLHTHLNQAGTTTGRMSSSSPNLQNIPIRGELGPAVRKAFIASPGYKWIACDYSQIEMRVLSLFSEDENLAGIFRRGEDVHTGVAAAVFGVPAEKVTSEMRREAKTINFGIIYGMGVQALRQNLGVSLAEAKKFYNEYFEKFPKVRGYFDRIKKEATERGYTETLFGRRRYFPALQSKIPYVRAQAERMVMNAPLQGTAADIIKIAMHKIDDELAAQKLSEKVHLLLQVHDELIYEAEEAVAKQAAVIVKNIMENAIESRLPFGANASVGENWAELKPVN